VGKKGVFGGLRPVRIKIRRNLWVFRALSLSKGRKTAVRVYHRERFGGWLHKTMLIQRDGRTVRIGVAWRLHFHS